MEDDDSDISMTIDESVSNEKTTASHLASVNVKSEVVSRHVSSPKLETDIKSDNEDINKSVDRQDKDFPPNNKNSENDIDMVISESDVPKSPKKVNGEVRSLECETGEQQSDVEISVKSATVDRVRLSEDEDKDTNFEPDNTKTSSKYKQISALSSEIKEVKESSQNIENNTEYKGFKKKIIAQTSVASNNISENVPSKQGASLRSSKSVKVKKTSKKTVSSESQHVLVSHQPLPDGTQSSAQLTEYAQYLGLQPTVKFKCYNCSESGFPTMPKLQEHQNICLKNVNKVQPIVKPTPPPTIPEPYPSTNFRITRKVYLCSACGTYYENWNLFLHMREVHRRHICLFCLGMFSQADKLATHLSGKHGVVEASYTSEDHFVGENKGSYFLMCCTCERIFSERENFYDHSCSEGLIINAERACSLCGLRGAHFPTCRRAFTDSNASPPSCSALPGPVENSPEPIQNSQHGVQERNATVSKYLIPVSKPPGKKVNKGNTVQESLGDSQEKPRDLSDIEDDYDISNAASFCHVNIHEPQEKQNAVKSKTPKRKNTDGAGKKTSIEAKPTESSPTASKQNENIENCVESSGEKDELEINTSITIEKNSEGNDKIVEEEKKEEEEEKGKKNETEVQNDNEKDTHNIPPEPETEKMDVDDQIEPEKCSSPEVPAKEETEVPLESETNKESEDRATPEKSKPAETNEIPVPKTEASPKLLPETEAKAASKTQSATEAESESDTSDSGDESDSSSSSEVSSEESDHHDDEKTEDKMEEESDADNADSDKMSLVVDENRSDDETELQSEKPTQEEGVVDGNRSDEETELQPEKPTREEEEEEDGEEVEEEEEEEEEKDESELQINEDETVKEDGRGGGEGEEEEEDDDEKSDVEIVDNVVDDVEENKSADEEKIEEPGESIQLAGDDVPLLELTLEENLDTMNIQLLLKESVKVSCLNCVYCNHAKKIAVNGKQLALHLLAEHRFAPVVCSDSGELTEADGFVDKLKSSLSELQQMFFNTDSYDNMDHNCMRPYDRTYECFHCHFLTTLHKELYVHNRKMHQKTILLCIMCKSNFYSYSELLCHMCPGIYVPESNINFRCCLCTVDGLPSAFRLMVHLRKRHHACDVCLETNGDQQKLSNHVWKHKLHHLCYRCGIAYRNKPDITKHLFWKHGTESVLCKKCLQKKWPHVYHFCIPPNAFVCEECNSSFSRAVALKVHKRLHAGDLPYQCDECEERFISRKLLVKHQQKHSEPTVDVAEANMQENGPSGEIENHEDDEEDEKLNIENESHQEVNKVIPELAAGNSDLTKEAEQERTKDSVPMALATEVKGEVDMDTSVAENNGEGSKLEEKDNSEKKSKVLDVYDLPPLNLSSDSDDSDEDGEIKVGAKSEKPAFEKDIISGSEGVKLNSETKVVENLPPQEEQDETQQPIQVIDGIWENFKTYKANLEKRENKPTDAEDILNKTTDAAEPTSNSKCLEKMIAVIHMDHDYCGPPAGSSQSATMEEIPEKSMTQLEDARHTSSLHDAEKTEEAKDKTDDELKACDADHNYCYTNTSEKEEKEKESTSEYPVSVVSPNKKKQKSPKKKQKRSASSSSSDSSSNSDSSSCSCGTNCSCSSSSSSSSGSSSSQSSDSDSSSSEGRRRQAARRERRRERAKKRKIEETEEAVQPPPPQQPSTPPQSPKVDPVETATNGPPGQEEASAIPSLVEPEDVELPVRESDLDTDETETDEDFYDKYPQKLANKLLAEKRNQLLLLAAVAPVNNGTMSQSCQSPPTSSVEEPVPKKKQKTKKHRKSQHQHIASEKKMESKIKLNIPTDYYSSQTPAYSKATVSSSSTNNSINTTSLATPTRTVQSPFHSSHPESSTPTTAYQSTGSGSETESKRLSKRKRVPKRFYGDSSDEEHEQQPPVKWRKLSVVSSHSPAPQTQSVPTFTYKSTPISVPEQFHNPPTPVPVNEDKSEDEEEEEDEDDEEEAEAEAADDSDSDLEDTKKSSSESSNSESEGDKELDDDPSDAESETEAPLMVQTNTVSVAREGNASVQQKNENLYCYCQCPYDEVSEMIACDGKDCTIEWFHFECVGIMVPPKGKWFCPDCRKKSALKSDHSSSNV